MKYVLLLLIICSCQQKAKDAELKSYAIITERKQLDSYGSGYETVMHVDSIKVENDSIAYHKAVIQYVASLLTEKKLNKQGIKNHPYYDKGFKVVDESGADIKHNLSKDFIESMDSFIASRPNQQ